MNHSDFIIAIQKLEHLQLPALNSHRKMAPLERIKMLEETNLNRPNARNAAVMMLFYPKNSKTHFALIKRNSYPGVHSSQIAFPGGKVEEVDENLMQTALRETHEEIGVHPSLIKVIRSFTTVYIPPSNYLVHPFFGFSEHEIQFILQVDEVAGIIETPLNLLLDDTIITSKTIETSYSRSIEIPAFQVYEHTVWGATAMMLSELKDMLKMVL
jgi:8-oxo-dGTP pyrophosphatase MutT (NUDIX family)